MDKHHKKCSRLSARSGRIWPAGLLEMPPWLIVLLTGLMGAVLSLL
jgi:hypothetical protein